MGMNPGSFPLFSSVMNSFLRQIDRFPCLALFTFFITGPVLFTTLSTAHASDECWRRLDSGIHQHDCGTASDPAVLWDSQINRYRMVFTTLDAALDRTVIAQATSKDGLEWKNTPSQLGVSGLILQGKDGDWDENMETAFLMRSGDEWLLYYTGYRDDAPAPHGNKVGDIGLAISSDGVTFTRVGDQPVLKHDPNGPDASGAYSPSIIVGDKMFMIYTGFCMQGHCDHGITVLGATSTDGIHWVKEPKPVLVGDHEQPWMHSVGEATFLKGPDQSHYLFYSGFREAEGAASIGWARSTDGPMGPYVKNLNPILRSVSGSYDEDDVIAPSVLIDGNRVRLWYIALDQSRDANGNHLKAPHFQIAYSECAHFFSDEGGFIELRFDDFEEGFGSFAGTSEDCRHFSNGSFNSIEIRGSRGIDSSFRCTQAMDLQTAEFTKLKVEFSYIAQGMEGEDEFWLLFYDGNQWKVVDTWASEQGLQNDAYQSATVIIHRANHSFSRNAKIMFGCNGNDPSDRVHIDKVRISAK